MPDFIKLHKRYHEQLDNGDRAQIKRATESEDLKELPAFYHLIQYAPESELTQLARFAFFLPMIENHAQDSNSLGRQLSQNRISEKRLFHIIRSDSPNDLIQLKRVLQQAKLSKVNWQVFGDSLFFWGKHQKKQLMKDFYLQPTLMEED